jgi:regulator of replication initiation timing
MSTVTSSRSAANLTPQFVLGLLSNIQVNIDEYQIKVLEMEEELRALKIENNILREQIRESTTTAPPEQKK